MSEQPLVRWLTGSKSITRKDRCSARRQWSHETRVETSLTESFGGCWPTNALWPVSWPWSDFLSTSCSYLLPGLLIWQGSAPWHVVDLMCSFPGRPSLFFQCLCSAWLNISDFSFGTGSTYADTSSALPCRIVTFPLNSNNLDDGTQLCLSPSHQGAKESHVSEQNWTPQQGLSVLTKHLSLCRLQEKVQGLVLVSAILQLEFTTQWQNHHVNPKLPVHCSVLCLKPIFVNLSCSLQNPNLPEVFVSLKASFSEHKKWLLFCRSFYTGRYVFTLQILLGKKYAGISH